MSAGPAVELAERVSRLEKRLHEYEQLEELRSLRMRYCRFVHEKLWDALEHDETEVLRGADPHVAEAFEGELASVIGQRVDGHGYADYRMGRHSLSHTGAAVNVPTYFSVLLVELYAPAGLLPTERPPHADPDPS